MTALKFACISPHPPIIVHEVGRGQERGVQRTIEALEQMARELAERRPETVVIIGTHGPVQSDAFSLLTAAAAEGDFAQWGAPQVRLHFPVDAQLVDNIRLAARQQGVPLNPVTRWDLDWSCTVPLYYLRAGLTKAKLVPLCISFRSPRQHLALGQAVRRALDRLGRPAAIIASADLSHRLSPYGPYGFHPDGPEFDRRIEEAVARWDVEAVLSFSRDFRERAAEDAVSSISFLMGALEGLAVRPRILSHEGPWGVGYMVVAVEILDEENSARSEPALSEAQGPIDDRPRPELAERRATARNILLDGVETLPESRVPRLPTLPSHPLVRLAQDAVEAWVRYRQVIALDDDPPEDPDGRSLPPRAGVFVSLRTDDGQLRGCLGTIEPTQPTLAQEVIRNAIDSATSDPRFLPVTPEELPDLVYTVDVLSPPEPIDGPDQMDPKRYGVLVASTGGSLPAGTAPAGGPGHGASAGNLGSARRGLLLPDLEGVETVEQQIAIAKAKAGIEPEEPVQLWRFEVIRLS